ncbi:DUF4333 domain-containing protein [Amycolatopsis rubida]|uniref:DUF4333 domain-containing protein n=1 Tax=Amycolatopsis rubida TaxID=112413 RepID=A0ABX0BFX8_9PSEU|nr:MULTISPECIES: DUF4333 domain-containing protein [Amycolatopsis]MYW89057.1 DUF4333 domain-containing protein [Amycolatopsis rubida]NEC54036.1 DUF4333 domain-containing protein [Amycolatopsis rubida]OAP23033.1 hypothetical protein A4R44_06115 [Amycolatopsis sp. M39]
MTQPPDQHPQGQPQWWQPGTNAPQQQPGYPAEADSSGWQRGQWTQPPAQQQFPQAQYPQQGYPAQPYGQPQSQPTPVPYGQPQSQPPPAPYGGPGQAPSQPTPVPQPPGNPYGGGFQPSEYGGLGAFSSAKPGKPRSKKPFLIAGAVVVVLAAAGGITWATGVFRGDTLDQKSLQEGVSRVLNENYGEPDVKNVACPSGQQIENGTTFDCTVQVGGQPKKVTVRVLNDKPEYSVGAPH